MGDISPTTAEPFTLVYWTFEDQWKRAACGTYGDRRVIYRF